MSKTSIIYLRESIFKKVNKLQFNRKPPLAKGLAHFTHCESQRDTQTLHYYPSTIPTKPCQGCYKWLQTFWRGQEYGGVILDKSGAAWKMMALDKRAFSQRMPNLTQFFTVSKKSNTFFTLPTPSHNDMQISCKGWGVYGNLKAFCCSISRWIPIDCVISILIKLSKAAFAKAAEKSGILGVNLVCRHFLLLASMG